MMIWQVKQSPITTSLLPILITPLAMFSLIYLAPGSNYSSFSLPLTESIWYGEFDSRPCATGVNVG
jgi:hypothetical protein